MFVYSHYPKRFEILYTKISTTSENFVGKMLMVVAWVFNSMSTFLFFYPSVVFNYLQCACTLFIHKTYISNSTNAF